MCSNGSAQWRSNAKSGEFSSRQLKREPVWLLALLSKPPSKKLGSSCPKYSPLFKRTKLTIPSPRRARRATNFSRTVARSRCTQSTKPNHAEWKFIPYLKSRKGSFEVFHMSEPRGFNSDQSGRSRAQFSCKV
jgi:hypothetical protein